MQKSHILNDLLTYLSLIDITFKNPSVPVVKILLSFWGKNEQLVIALLWDLGITLLFIILIFYDSF